MLKDNRALQAGTSHHLGQNFSRQFELKFATESGQEEFAWNTSWGVSTRLVGGLVMTHGDDKGLVMPPAIAPIQVVIVPIARKDDERAQVLEKARSVAEALGEIRTHIDDRENLSPGASSTTSTPTSWRASWPSRSCGAGRRPGSGSPAPRTP